jgi:hypothetical protein
MHFDRAHCTHVAELLDHSGRDQAFDGEGTERSTEMSDTWNGFDSLVTGERAHERGSDGLGVHA